MVSATERCEICRFWKARKPFNLTSRDPSITDLGACRRYPKYELTEAGNWCGEFSLLAAGEEAPMADNSAP